MGRYALVATCDGSPHSYRAAYVEPDDYPGFSADWAQVDVSIYHDSDDDLVAQTSVFTQLTRGL